MTRANRERATLRLAAMRSLVVRAERAFKQRSAKPDAISHWLWEALNHGEAVRLMLAPAPKPVRKKKARRR